MKLKDVLELKAGDALYVSKASVFFITGIDREQEEAYGVEFADVTHPPVFRLKEIPFSVLTDSIKLTDDRGACYSGLIGNKNILPKISEQCQLFLDTYKDIKEV